jgi:pimeloyl-ACP methyl ester carboxylesterase
VHRILNPVLTLSACTFFIGCSGSDTDGGPGPSTTGGTQSGGTHTGGASNSGGVSTTGGATTGGATTGGASTGGVFTGGVSTGGASTGGASGAGPQTTGGTSSAGAPAAGNTSGGSSSKGGAGANGGATAKGGSSSGGAGGGGSGGVTAAGGTGGGAGTAGAATAGSTSTAGTGGETPSTGCGETPKLTSSNGSSNFTPNTIMVAGTSRQYVLRRPQNYDKAHPYRLILDLHGYGGSYSETAGNYFGLWSLSKDSTIFVALSAPGGDWASGDNLAYVDEVLKAVQADLCIDKSRIMLEGFSQGAAMSWSLACSRPGIFRAMVGHSGGGVANPTSCQPIPYLGSGGLQESVTQTTQSDKFAKWNACTVSTLPTAKTGSHVCTDYTGCPATAPVRWCSYDGPHTPSPSDSGQGMSWMPQEVWTFFSKF